jgi:hypothetical protein
VNTPDLIEDTTKRPAPRTCLINGKIVLIAQLPADIDTIRTQTEDDIEWLNWL